VPIVPVAIDGAFEVWPRNRPINWRVLLPWSRHRIRVTFGAPVRLEQHQSHADAAAELRAIVQDLLTRAPSPSTSRSR
jgi:hypothetical protein